MIKSWGADNLMRYDASVVAGLKIPQESKDFLIDVGMPRWYGADRVFGFPTNDLPSLLSVSEEHFSLPPNYIPLRFDFPQKYRSYHILGIDGFDVKKTQGQELGPVFSFVCLDERTEGRILRVRAGWYKSGKPRWEAAFFNSSVLHLAKFLILTPQRSPRFKKALARRGDVQLTYEEQERLFRAVGQRIVRRLQKIDPPACALGAVWSPTLSHYRLGM